MLHFLAIYKDCSQMVREVYYRIFLSQFTQNVFSRNKRRTSFLVKVTYRSANNECMKNQGIKKPRFTAAYTFLFV